MGFPREFDSCLRIRIVEVYFGRFVSDLESGSNVVFWGRIDDDIIIFYRKYRCVLWPVSCVVVL